MNDLLSSISHHGYLLLAIVCFAEAVGLPLPAALAILTAGAVAAYGDLHLYLAIGRIFLPPRQADTALCQIYPRHQRHVSAARRKHENAAGPFSAIRFPRGGFLRGRILRRGISLQ